MADQPSWLRDDTPTPSPAAAPGPSAGGAAGTSSSTSSSAAGPKSKTEWKFTAQIMLAVISIGLCGFIGYVGGKGIQAGALIMKQHSELEEKGEEDWKAFGVASSDVYIGVYMNLFAFILFLYEIGYLTKWDLLNNFLKRNVGFLYGPIGNCCYSFFAAAIVFGLSTPRDLAIGSGTAMAAWGPIKGLYYLRFPDHFDQMDKYNPKTDGVRM